MTRWTYIRNAWWVCLAAVCTACGDGGEPKIATDVPPNGAVASTYNVGDGTTCAPSATACQPCFVGGSIRACPANWRYRNSFSFVATDGLAPYFWTAAALPPGITVSTNGSIQGTPTTAGTYLATVTVTDSSLPAERVTQKVTIVIDEIPAPTIETSPAPARGAINRPYTNVFAATGGVAPLTWSESGTLPPGLDFTDNGTLSGTPTEAAAFPVTLVAEDAAGQSAIPLDTTIDISTHGFRATGSMASPRALHTATLLDNGLVLVAGGFDGTNGLATAELYDPVGATFLSTGALTTPGRYNHSATLLANGTVLLVGGLSAPAGPPVATAQVFVPSSGRFNTTGAPVAPRYSHTATLLDDGTVLVTGGIGAANAPLGSAEIYDPGTGRFVTVDAMTTPRAGHTATLLSNGDVLVVGGVDDAQGTTLKTAEIYDPRTRRFTATGSMQDARAHQVSVLLANGDVLIAGGIADESEATAETYDPATGTFASTADMLAAHSAPTATLLVDGTVLLTGAGDDHTHLIADSELFGATDATFTGTGSMTNARDGHTATLLQNGQVLVAGGSNGAVLATAELYQ